jgi:hypothetical protein
MEFVGVEDKQYNTKLLCTYDERQPQIDVRNYESHILGRLKYVWLTDFFQKNQTLTLVFTILNRKYIRIIYCRHTESKPGDIRSVRFLSQCYIIPDCC